MKIYQGNRVRNLPSLGERVCNIGSTRVPFGLRGLVVSIHPRTRCVEVVFDEIFVGGTNLSGLCSKDRGFLLPWRHLMSFSSTGQSVGVSGQGFSSVVKNKKKNEVKRDGDMSSLPLLMPFGDAKVEDGTSVSKKKESVKKEKVKKEKVKKVKKKVSAEPTKKKEESSQVLTGMLQRALGTDQRPKTTTAPDASVLTNLLQKAMTPKPPPKSILPVSFFDQSDVISTKPASNSTQAKVSAVPIHSSLQKFLNISSPSSKVEKTAPKEDVDIKKKVEEMKKKIEEEKKKKVEEEMAKKKQIEEERKKKRKAEEKKKKKAEEKKKKAETKKKKAEETKKKKAEEERRKKKKANEDKKKKKKPKKKDAPKRVVKKILSRNEKKKERSEDEAVVLTADGVEISLDPMAFWNEMEAEADNEYEAERRARRLQRQAEREERKKNKTSS